MCALIDIPLHVFVAVFIVITPRLHNSQNNFLFYDFVEREKRWRTVFRRHNKNLFPFPWNQRGYKNWLERGAALLPCAHNENKFAFLFFSVCAISVTLSLSLSLFSPSRHKIGPSNILSKRWWTKNRKFVTFQLKILSSNRC